MHDEPTLRSYETSEEEHVAKPWRSAVRQDRAWHDPPTDAHRTVAHRDGLVGLARTCAAAHLLAVLLVAVAVAEVAPRPSGGCAHTTVATGRRIERTLDVDGQARAFILDVPTSVAAAKPAPLLLDFHGFGHSGAGVWKVSEFRNLAEAGGFITVYPEGITVRFIHRERAYDGIGWELAVEPSNRDVRFVAAMLDTLEAEYCIDRNRVFSTGFSNGGYFSHLLGCVMADRIAAIAPVSGGKRPTPCAPSRPVPALIIHGRQDEIIDVADARAARDSWVAGNGCGPATGSACLVYGGCRNGAAVEYCEGDFAHRWPPEATARIWEFLRRHPLKAGTEGSRDRGIK